MNTHRLWRKFWLYAAFAAALGLLMRFTPQKIFKESPMTEFLVTEAVLLSLTTMFIFAALDAALKLLGVFENRHDTQQNANVVD
jgi:hypothetical protein